MRRVLLILLISLIFTPSVKAVESEKLPNIFIWSTPAPTEKLEFMDDNKNSDAEESDYLTDEEIEKLSAEKDAKLLAEQQQSTKKKEKISRKEKKALEEAEQLKHIQISDDDSVMAGVLKGYAEYRDDIGAVYLKDDNDEFVLNLTKPQSLTSNNLNLKKSKIFNSKGMNLSKYASDEYQISKSNYEVRSQINDHFSFGTSYDTSIFRSQLEKSADFFAEYKYKNFSVATSYERYTADMYNGQYYDTIYFAPTYRFNKNFAIKEVIGSSMTTQKKTAELVLQISPFAHKGNDRLNFEIGAKQYFDQTNELYRTRLKFSTMFKL